MAALVFVTTELAPFTPGGIGRVLHNMLRSVGEEDRARCIVVAVGFAIDDLSFAVTFPAVRLIRADVRDSVLQDHSSRHLPPRWAYSHSDLHWQSAAVMSTLEQLARTTAIEYVEFPDWGGLAFCTLQERRFSGLLADACLAVRLHSTHTQILNAEPYAVTPIDLHIADIERKCLRDCDRIVAQIPSVAEATRRLLDFDIAEWDHRIIVHAPPVLLDYSLPALQSVEAGPLQSLMFTSKMQRLKRADVFVRGVTAFMRRDADFHGRACLSAHRTDGAFCEIVDRLIPDDLKSRFAFTPAMSAREREMAISTATVVVASASESFCLAAYEASLLGARVILNGQNPAFDDTSPWRDAVNCFKFDGSASGLAETLERSHAASARLTVVELRSDPWPWQHRCPSDDEETCTSLSQFGADPDPEALDYAAPLVSIVIPHFNLGSYLCETLDSVIAMTYRNIEIVVVNDASTDRSSVEIIDKLGLIDEARFQVVQPSGNVGLAAARNLGIRHARGRYVLTLDADDLIDPAFVSKAVHALERHPEFDLVVTPAAYFNDGEDISTLDCTEAMAYGIFTGEARIAGLLENRFSTATALFRKTVLERFPYNEDLHCYEDWSLYMRMCDAGVRCIVTTGVYFFYRRRADSMLNRPRSGSIRHLEYADMLRTSASPALRVGSRHLVLGLPACVAESARRHAAASPDVEAMLQRVLSSESSLRAVYRCLAPVAKVFRLLRFVWNRMLPLRRKMVHARGRLSRTFKYRA